MGGQGKSQHGACNRKQKTEIYNGLCGTLRPRHVFPRNALTFCDRIVLLAYHHVMRDSCGCSHFRAWPGFGADIRDGVHWRYAVN